MHTAGPVEDSIICRPRQLYAMKRGGVDTGSRLLRTALDELRKTGSVLRYTAFLGVLAEDLAEAGRFAEGLTVDQASTGDNAHPFYSRTAGTTWLSAHAIVIRL